MTHVNRVAKKTNLIRCLLHKDWNTRKVKNQFDNDNDGAIDVDDSFG